MNEVLNILSTTLNPSVLLYTFIGVGLGIFIGSLPGLTATMGCAILLPLTFWLEPHQGLGMLFGVYSSALYAGGISAVLINMPGTPASIASTFDGYKIVKRGEAKLALWINTTFSVIGGLFGVFMFSIASFSIARFALRFGAPEYAMLGLFGLSMMVSVSGKSLLKGILSGFIGLGIVMIGLDPIYSVKRYVFNSTYLIGGISFIPIMIGLFGIGESLNQLTQDIHNPSYSLNIPNNNGKLRKHLSFIEFWKMKFIIFFTGIISVLIGAVPGTGGDIAGIISWTQSKNISKDKSRYGKGSEEGLAVTCTANNACIGGALTTMLTLGIPGDTVTAVLIGALLMYDITPGPLLFKDHPDMIIRIIILLVLCNIFILLLGNIGSLLFAKFVELPRSWVSISIICFSLVGAYALNNNPLDVTVCFISGIIGFGFLKTDFPTPPLVLGLILGRMVEANFMRSLLLSRGNYLIFFTRPISLILIIFIILSLFLPSGIKVFKKYLMKRT